MDKQKTQEGLATESVKTQALQEEGSMLAETITEKTYTQDEINIREASARKAAEDRTRKEILKQLGVKDISELDNARKAIEAASVAEEAKQTTVDKIQNLAQQLSGKDAEVSTLISENRTLRREVALVQSGVNQKLARRIAKGMTADIEDAEAFSAEVLEIVASLPKPQAEAAQPSDGTRRVSVSTAALPTEANDQPNEFVGMYKKAKERRDGVAMTRIARLAAEKGISVSS